MQVVVVLDVVLVLKVELLGVHMDRLTVLRVLAVGVLGLQQLFEVLAGEGNSIFGL